MNGKKARALRKAKGPKPAPDYPVRRTRPLTTADGRFVGHVTKTKRGRLILTPNGRESMPKRFMEDGRTVIANKSHEVRIKAARSEP